MKNVRDVRVGRKDLHSIPPSELAVREGYNVRFIDRKSPDFIELKESIRAHGVRTPLTVQTEKKDGENVFYIVAGHRRHAAVEELVSEGVEILSVPCISVRMGQEELALDLIVSNGGKPLNQLEQGAAFKRLEGYGWPVDRIARETGKSTKHIYNCIQLQSLPASVKKKINKETISSSLALELLKDHGPEEVEAAIKEAQTNAGKSDQDKITRKNTRKSSSQGKRSPKVDITQRQYDTVEVLIDQIPECMQDKFLECLNGQFVVS